MIFARMELMTSHNKGKKRMAVVDSGYSMSYKMGFFEEFSRNEVDYWYKPSTYTEIMEITSKMTARGSIYYRLRQSIPLKVNKETHEVTIDRGILNILIK